MPLSLGRNDSHASTFWFLMLTSLPHLLWAAPIANTMTTRARFYFLPEFWLRLLAIAALVLLGGIFAGLTLGLMGLDQTNLQVMVESGTETESKNASKVLRLLNRGKHWVLVTLLLSNVIVNETLPIILDSVLGGGWQAILISTALIVIFGEVIPQSICVRHGLAIGARCSIMVLILMYIMYPVAYPTALVLDYFLGESHGTVYKKAGLKTLVSLHQAQGQDREGLTEDEVHIIGSVLDLGAKPVARVMTPIEDVFTLTYHSVLDEATVNKILTAGYSRIPIREENDESNFIGVLLVKHLITYDAEKKWPVHQFQLNPLPETATDTSCLDILNFFQEGRSHMALVSQNPGAHGGALGVITLEDVIEELIGEEIIDETDVYVDVHNKVKVTRGKAQPPPPELEPLLKLVRTTSTVNANRARNKARLNAHAQSPSRRASTPTPSTSQTATLLTPSTEPLLREGSKSPVEEHIKGYGATEERDPQQHQQEQEGSSHSKNKKK
ncbi:hypothetical protein BCR43DRAFT_556605 [Syncephalastrum racemosum]|uniref:CNNM transmembrane domain-containing protein n=1 Tax=Syncephalastrum racemosum TaxID=13706 RepID=A0A1X2HJB5_SYNRA|nr:hypothetical protein BCR43DRAFT_556605 [Syncephalastrum racemosum]